MLNYNIYEILLQVANRYNLQLKCFCDTERCGHFLIKEERSEFPNPFVEKIYRNSLYVDTTFDCICFEIYNNYKKVCHVEIHEERKIRVILKNMERYYKDCQNYCDFLYSLAMYLKKKG